MNYKMPGNNVLTLPAFLKLHLIKKDDNPTNKASTHTRIGGCLLYTSPSPRDVEESRMPSSA